jgi:hypothetical protein
MESGKLYSGWSARAGRKNAPKYRAADYLSTPICRNYPNNQLLSSEASNFTGGVFPTDGRWAAGADGTVTF